MEKAKTRAEFATARLRQILMRGDFAPNSKLTEVGLAALLGVSRTPIRDALGTLAQEGLLSYEPNRGYEVRSCTLEEVVGAYRVRQTLEALACRLAAERGLDVTARARMMDATERNEALLKSGAWRQDHAAQWRSLNASFHAAIADAAANPMLTRAIRDTQRLPILVAGGGSKWFTHEELVLVFDDDNVRQSHKEHVAILGALIKRRGEQAGDIMAEHIGRACDILRRLWDSPGFHARAARRERAMRSA